MDSRFALRRLPATRILRMSVRGGVADVSRGIERLRAHAASFRAGPVGPLLVTLTPGSTLDDDRAQVEVSVLLTRDLPDEGEIRGLRQPSRSALCVLVEGPGLAIREAVVALRAEWVARGLGGEPSIEIAFLDGGFDALGGSCELRGSVA